MKVKERGSPISTATNLFYDIQKCFDCNHDELDEDEGEFDSHEDDDLSSASGDHDENHRDQQLQEDFPEEFRVQDNWPHTDDIPHSTSEVNNEEGET